MPWVGARGQNLVHFIYTHVFHKFKPRVYAQRVGQKYNVENRFSNIVSWKQLEKMIGK